MMNSKESTLDLKEGIDFYFNDQGLMVLTEAYLIKRGHCCQSGCLHCPWGHTDKVDPLIPSELADEEFEQSNDYDPWDDD